jgi:hypothetical protein
MSTTAGRVPVRLRVGVTGHRTIPDEDAIAARVDDVLVRLLARLPTELSTPVLLEIVSPLGEGTDRIVAERALEIPGAILEVPLPLAADDYERDFETPASRDRFRALLARAERSWVVNGGTDRIDAYRETGAYVVDSCDVLIAVWDGLPPRGPGGTGDVVDRAMRQRMPVFVIGVDDPFDVQNPIVPIAPHLIPDIERFNDDPLPHAAVDADQTMPGADDPDPVTDTGGQETPTSMEEATRLASCVDWVEPSRRRAARIAGRARTRFTWGSRALFLLSAFAILAVALSVTSEDDVAKRGFAYLEVALIVAALALWLRVRHGFHGRWIASRFLAERLRSAGFLAFVGERSGIGSTPAGDRAGHHDPSQEWINRVCREVWRSRPRFDDATRTVDDVTALVAQDWVSPQLRYYETRARDHRTVARILIVAGALLFAGTIAAATLHASELADGGVEKTAVVLSIALPAFAAALAGIAGLELHARHAAKFDVMARRLGDLRDRLEWASDLDRVRELTHAIEAELRTEGESWIDVLRFQDVELPS